MKQLPVRLPNHVGDACMALPAIGLLAQSGLEPLLVGRRWADALFSAHRWPIVTLQGDWWTDVRVLREARLQSTSDNATGRGGNALLLPNSFSSALMFRAAGLRSAGLATDARRWLLDVALPVPAAGSMHEVERFFAVAAGAIQQWGISLPAERPPASLGLAIGERQFDAADQLLQQHRVPARFALLAPIATGLHRGQVKQWPHFDALARQLAANGLPPVAVPTAHEADATRSAIPDALILPPVDLGVLAALTRRASIVVANDSGVSHVAAAAGARQVTVVGVTDPRRTGPWSPRAVVAGSLGQWPTIDQTLAAIDRALEQ